VAAEGGESMADAYDEMERLMKEYEALAQSDLPAALEKMIDLYFDETYENTFNYDVYDGIFHKVRLLAHTGRDAGEERVLYTSEYTGWEKTKKAGIIDADFYLADLLSRQNITLREKLYVLLRETFYELDRKIALSLKKDEAKEDEAAIGKQVSVLEPPATKAERPLPGNETKLRVR